MAEYIDRKALIGKLEKRYCAPCKGQDGDLGGDWCRFCMASNAIKEVQKIPAADVAPARHGHWIKTGSYACGENEYLCSECKETEWRTSASRLKYCPFCGSKMDGGAD